MSDELFSQGNVRVTKTMAYLGGTSYPINGITAVFVARKSANILIVIYAIALAITGLFVIGQIVFAGLGLLAIAGALIYWVFQRRPYLLMLRTAAGDTQGLQDRSEKFIESVRLAIESAVAQRG